MIQTCSADEIFVLAPGALFRRSFFDLILCNFSLLSYVIARRPNCLSPMPSGLVLPQWGEDGKSFFDCLTPVSRSLSVRVAFSD
jgi:hypothetical protein